MPRTLAHAFCTVTGLAFLGLSILALGTPTALAQLDNTVSVTTADPPPRVGNAVGVSSNSFDPQDVNDAAADYTILRRPWTASGPNQTADLSILKDDGVVTVTAGGTVTYTITVSNQAPSGLGRLFVYVNETGQISELDPANGNVLNSFASPVAAGANMNADIGGPTETFGMATTPTSLLVGGAFRNPGGIGAIFELDPDTGATIRSIPNPGMEIFAMAYRNGEIFLSGAFAFEASDGTPRIVVLDYATGAVKRAMGFGCLQNYPTGLAWSAENLSSIGFDLVGLVPVDPQNGYWIDPLTGNTVVIDFGFPNIDDCLDIVEALDDVGIALSGGGLGVIGDEVFGMAGTNTIDVYDLETSTFARSIPGAADGQNVGAIGADEVSGADVVGATVTDSFPADLSCTWTCVANGGASCTAGPVSSDINDTVDIPLGDSVVYTAVCDIDPAATGTLSNTATVTAPIGITDIDSNNDSSTDVDTLEEQADLSITKSDDLDPIAPGGTLTYTVDVDNAGPSDATSVVVTETLPAGVTFSATSGCAEDPNGVPTCTLGTIPAGGSASYTVEVTVDPATPTSTITNVVDVSSATTDPISGNDSASESTMVDADPPIVTLVDSIEDTGDGMLDECEDAKAAITALLVTFDEDVQDPLGDDDASDVTNPANYRLLAAGPDRDFSTSTCGAPLGDDVLISVDAVTYDAGSSTATLEVNAGSPLGDDLYRLLVCGSTTIRDLVGNALDGNADGTGGDDFVRTYRVSRTNQFVNGNLDCSIDAWTAVSTDPNEITYSTEDVDNSSLSGSVQITNLTA
ncbi:MAG: DUF11 domain-containing protein, partial [Acidobacteriota bacterium]